ncbi:hypothetical protein GQ600_15837 [Phytophthora cactorum]|nr:hypothetical protein GQ600_15837 [Phytophthora cactorum]
MFGQLDWVYGDVPYLFCYSVARTKLAIFAIMPSHQSGVHVSQLGPYYHLDQLNDRLQLLLALLNMSRLLRTVAGMCPEEGKDEFLTFPRPQWRLRLRWSEARDRESSSGESVRSPKTSAVRMLSACRASAAQFNRIIRCDSRCLGGSSEIPRVAVDAPRYSMGNVMKVSDGNSWFLIDFMDAAPSPQDAASDHLNPYNHAPEIVDRSFKHTTAVDIWLVGYLIDTAGVEDWDRVRREMHSRTG